MAGATVAPTDRAAARPRLTALWLILTAYAMLALMQNAALPMFEAPDEGAHFYYADYLARYGRLPALTENADTHEVFQPPLYYALVATAIAPLDRANLDLISVRNRDWWEVRGVTNQYLHFPVEDFPYQGAPWAVRLARVVSAALGALTVVAVYFTAALVAPGRRAVAPLAAAAVAFNPKFVNVASMVNNDIAVILAASVACWWMCRMVARATARSADFGVLGGLIGAAALCKISGLGLLLPAAFVLLLELSRSRQRSFARGARFALSLAAGLGLTLGWWLLFSTQQFGDPLASALVRDANAPLARGVPLAAAEIVALMPRLFSSYWGVLGIDLALPGWMDAIYLLGLLAAVAGCAVFFARAAPAERRVTLLRLTPLLLWQLAVIVAFIPWLRGVTDTENSRLLMPAVSLVATLVAIGWAAWIPTRRERAWAAPALLMLGLAALAPFIVIAPAFARPTYLSAYQIEWLRDSMDVTFGDRVRLLSAALDKRDVAPGDALRVNVTWGAIRPMQESLRAIVEAVDADQRVIGRVEAIPFNGRFASRYWEAGRVFEDEYELPIDRAAARGVAEVRIGLRSPYEQPDILPVGGANAGRFTVGKVKVLGPEPPDVAAANPALFAPGATFGPAIRLEGFSLSDGSTRPVLTLAFRALHRPAKDYTLFVHAFDKDGKLIAQVDGQPHAGAYPTSFWSTDERVIERRSIDLPAQTARLNIGWYDPATGERLAALKADGSAWRDNTVILIEK